MYCIAQKPQYCEGVSISKQTGALSVPCPSSDVGTQLADGGEPPEGNSIPLTKCQTAIGHAAGILRRIGHISRCPPSKFGKPIACAH